jgi:hypothetical protein
MYLATFEAHFILLFLLKMLFLSIKDNFSFVCLIGRFNAFYLLFLRDFQIFITTLATVPRVELYWFGDSWRW